MKRIRVIVADDSLTVRKHLVEVLERDPGVEVVGEAVDGRQAVDLCLRERPDVMTMDMMMPVMTGLAATEEIMAHGPTPILIVSASLNRGEVFRTYDALAAGAVDVIEKPSGTVADERWEKKFLATVKLVSRIAVITHPRAKLRRFHRPDALASTPRGTTSRGMGRHRLVAIGASTGGPAAAQRILSGLPVGFPLPILMVIHVSAPFAIALSDWLNASTPLLVRPAIDGERLPEVGRSVVLMAPADAHLLLDRSRLRLSDGAPRHSCKPSVDVLFESIAAETGGGAVACLLTGMGRDGASGLLAIRRAGGLTIAQNEASSVVYGMPREAALVGGAERILSIEEIAPALVEAAGVVDVAGVVEVAKVRE